MYTIRQTGMARKKPEGPTITFQLKLYGEEAGRWLKLYEQAKSRNPYINATGVNRRLLGLDPDVDGTITEKDRLFFLGGKARAEMIGRAKETKPHIQEVSPKIKGK